MGRKLSLTLNPNRREKPMTQGMNLQKLYGEGTFPIPTSECTCVLTGLS